LKNVDIFIYLFIYLFINLFLYFLFCLSGPSERYNCWRYRYLWSNDTCPDIDPVRILLAYLYCIGWKGGTLFPSVAELGDPPANGIYTTTMEEGDLYSMLKVLWEQVLRRTEKLGSQTARKTGYLFAALMGCKSVASMMEAADHDCPKVVLRYLQDAESIMEINHCFNDPKQRVGLWRSPFCRGGENTVASCAPGAEFQCPLPHVSIWTLFAVCLFIILLIYLYIYFFIF
jgi:hypothetical protein